MIAVDFLACASGVSNCLDVVKKGSRNTAKVRLKGVYAHDPAGVCLPEPFGYVNCLAHLLNPNNWIVYLSPSQLSGRSCIFHFAIITGAHLASQNFPLFQGNSLEISRLIFGHSESKYLLADLKDRRDATTGVPLP